MTQEADITDKGSKSMVFTLKDYRSRSIGDAAMPARGRCVDRATDRPMRRGETEMAALSKQAAPWPDGSNESGSRKVSSLVNRNVTLPTGRTSIRLDPEHWKALAEICQRENMTPGDLAMKATEDAVEGGRTSAIRVFILNYFRASGTDEGHAAAGHGRLKPEDA